MLCYQGLLSNVHQHFWNRMRTLPEPIARASVVLVPSRPLAASLGSRVGDGPPIRALDDRLEQVLPQHIMRLPQGAWEMLSHAIPDDVLDSRHQAVPGLTRTALTVVRQGRQQGMPPFRAHPDDTLPWDALWRHVDERLSGSAWDELRMYEYAARSAKVPTAADGIVFLYGFNRIARPLWALIREWSRRVPVELWALSPLWDGISNERVKRFSGRIEMLSQPGPKRAFEMVPGDAFRGVARVMIERGVGVDDVVVAVSDARDIRPIARAFAEAHLIAQPVAQPPEAKAHWELLLRLSLGRATGGERNYWEMVAPALGWAVELPTVLADELLQCRDWQQVIRCMEDLARHDSAWTFLAEEAKCLALYDTWGVPVSAESLFEALGQLVFSQARDLPIMPFEEAVWVPSAVLAIAGRGPVPRPRHHSPFDHEKALRDWLPDSWPESVDALLLQALKEDSGIQCWWMVGQMPEDSDWRGQPDDRRASDRVRAWYRDWREEARFTAYQGVVSGDAVAELIPTRFSASALEEFGRCPTSFLLSRLIGARARQESGVEVDPRLAGQWAHRALEILVRQRGALTRTTVAQAVQQAMDDNPAPPGVAEFHRRYQRDRLESELYEAFLRDGWDPTGTSEVEVTLNWDLIVPMTGRIDRLDFLPDGSMRVIDYKTGHLVNPSRIHPAHLQLALYWLAVYERYQRPLRAELFGVSQMAGYQHRVLEVDDPEALKEKVEHLLSGIRDRMHQGLFLPLPDPRGNPCRGCDFRDVCPASVAEYARRKGATGAQEYRSLWEGDEHGND
nr:PD-(D/E)XK nuclease family protein [Sulfobacillus harzensis]